MNPVFFAVHLISAIWIWKSWSQWCRYQLSNSLFVLFVGFLLLANIAPYFARELDTLVQLFGIQLAVRAGFYVSIVALFVSLKHLHRKMTLQERSVARLARSFALDRFQATYMNDRETTLR